MQENSTKDFLQYIYLCNELNALYHGVSLSGGISDSVMNILYTLSTFGTECTQSNISQLTGIPRQTINSAIRKLEKQEILYLEGERKNKIIRLTEKGTALANRTAIPLLRAEQATFAGWSVREREALLNLTKKYIIDLKRNMSQEIYR